MPRRSQRPIRSQLPATLARSGITGLRDVTALSQQLIMMAAAARQSRFGGGEGDPMPPPECMFKAAKDGPVNSRLQAFLRSRGFPEWFTVAVGPKGSYRESDVIQFLHRHLESWRDDRKWRIMLCDDYSVNTSQNIWNLCWARGYIRMCHRGGSTPVSQPLDTDLNQHVRRE